MDLPMLAGRDSTAQSLLMGAFSGGPATRRLFATV
jgi:hypothetical protein